MPFVLALDVGTTSCRAVLFDQTGQQISSEQKEFTQYFPQPGYVEHDAEEIWQALCFCIETLLQKTHILSKDITCVGMTNQRETVVIWDKKAQQPLHKAIVWQDRRTSDLCYSLKKEGYEPLLRKKTGLVIDPYFSATKMHYLLNQFGYQNHLALCTMDSWLIYKLTGGACHLTDSTNASRTQLFNIHTLSWDEELSQLFKVPMSFLPSVSLSNGFFGEISHPHCLKGVPIYSAIGDQQASLFGQLCLKKGMTKCTYGTGCFILMNLGNTPILSQQPLLTTVAFHTQSTLCYALEGSVFIGGALIQWLRDNLGIINSVSEIETLAKEVSTTGGVFFVPSFTGLGAPHWNPSAQGVIVGLTRGTQRTHLARAALEAIAFQVSDVVDVMRQENELPISSFHADGGASRNHLLMQMQAKTLNTTIFLPEYV